MGKKQGITMQRWTRFFKMDKSTKFRIQGMLSMSAPCRLTEMEQSEVEGRASGIQEKAHLYVCQNQQSVSTEI
jgi:hypothetical protein